MMLSVRPVFWFCFLPFVHFQYFSILRKCNMMEKVQHGNSRGYSAKGKNCNMRRVQQEKNAKQKCNV